MHLPQIIYIAISAISLGITMGEGKKGFGTNLAAQIITYALLIWGGFFNH